MYDAFVLANLFMAILIDVAFIGGTILAIIDYVKERKNK